MTHALAIALNQKLSQVQILFYLKVGLLVFDR